MTGGGGRSCLASVSSRPLRDVLKLGLGRLRLAAAGRYLRLELACTKEMYEFNALAYTRLFPGTYLHKNVKWNNKQAGPLSFEPAGSSPAEPTANQSWFGWPGLPQMKKKAMGLGEDGWARWARWDGEMGR